MALISRPHVLGREVVILTTYGHFSCVMWHWIDFRVGAVEGLLLFCVLLDVGDYNEMHVLMISHHYQHYLGCRGTVYISDYIIHMFMMRCEGMIRYAMNFLCIS